MTEYHFNTTKWCQNIHSFSFGRMNKLWIYFRLLNYFLNETFHDNFYPAFLIKCENENMLYFDILS